MLDRVKSLFRLAKPTPAPATTLPKLYPVKENFLAVSCNRLPLPLKGKDGKYTLNHADEHPVWDDDDDRIILRTGVRLILPPHWAAITAVHPSLRLMHLGYYDSQLLTCDDVDEICVKVMPVIGFENDFRVPAYGAPLLSIWIIPAPQTLTLIEALEYQHTIEAWKAHWDDALEMNFKPNQQ